MTKAKFDRVQCTRVPPISLRVCCFSVKKADPEAEVIKNKGGKRRDPKGYVDKKEKNKIKLRGNVDVWRNITVEQLAKGMKLDLGNVDIDAKWFRRRPNQCRLI